MQWAILRKFVDLALCGAIFAPFQACATANDVWFRILGLNQLEFIGLVACCLMLATDILFTLREIKNWIAARLR